MDLHRTSSRAPVCDAERPPSGAFELPAASAAQFAHPDADARIAARFREDGPLDALEAQITRLWGHINAATAQFLALVAQFDRKEGWAQHGMASCANWLSWQCGIGPVAARGCGERRGDRAGALGAWRCFRGNFPDAIRAAVAVGCGA